MTKSFQGFSSVSIIQKRLFDLFFSLLGLLLLWWLILLSALFAWIDTREKGFFTQVRVGQFGKVFKVIKISTMKSSADVITTVTTSNDSRITNLGKFFRKKKIDELPQLINVLLGQMSFVGPRPDVPGFADRLKGKDKIILSVRPGITGPAQLAYKNEEDILAKQDDIIKYNNEVIWPDKVAINMKYIENYSFFKDIYYIWKTVAGGNAKY